MLQIVLRVVKILEIQLDKTVNLPLLSIRIKTNLFLHSNGSEGARNHGPRYGEVPGWHTGWQPFSFTFESGVTL